MKRMVVVMTTFFCISLKEVIWQIKILYGSQENRSFIECIVFVPDSGCFEKGSHVP